MVNLQWRFRIIFTARQRSCGEVLFSQACVCLSHMTITNDAFWMSLYKLPHQALAPALEIRLGDPQPWIMQSGGHHCRLFKHVHKTSLYSPPPPPTHPQEQHLVAIIEGVTISTKGRYASYLNAFLYILRVPACNFYFLFSVLC